MPRLQRISAARNWTERHATARQTRTTASSGLGKGIMATMLRVIGGTLESETLENGYRARLTMPVPAA